MWAAEEHAIYLLFYALPNTLIRRNRVNTTRQHRNWQEISYVDRCRSIIWLLTKILIGQIGIIIDTPLHQIRLKIS
jgi:hypothetical protein